MDSLYLLVPLSVVLVLAIGGILAWSVMSGQFENLEGEGRRILDDEPEAPVADPAPVPPHHAADSSRTPPRV